MHQGTNGRWTENAMPDPLNSASEFFMEEGEWKKFFVAFQKAFRNMSADREKLEKNSPDAVKFLDEYFGNSPSQIFTNSIANIFIIIKKLLFFYYICGCNPLVSIIKSFL